MVLVVRSILRPDTDPVRAAVGPAAQGADDPEWPAPPPGSGQIVARRPVLSSSAPR